MKKLILLFLFVGLFSLIGCDKYHAHEKLYTGILADVEYYPGGGFFGRSEQWLITFEDGAIFCFCYQPDKGYAIGKTYMVYRKPSAPGTKIKKLD